LNFLNSDVCYFIQEILEKWQGFYFKINIFNLCKNIGKGWEKLKSILKIYFLNDYL
jgi:hypothetical protein